MIYDEMDSLLKYDTWEIVDRPQDKRIFSSRCLFNLKEGIPGVEAPRFKARIVARRFTQGVVQL